MRRKQQQAMAGGAASSGAFVGLLRRDHGQLSRVLSEVDAQATRLAVEPDAARAVLLDALRYLLDYQHAFHHPGEDRLFRRLRARVPALRADLNALMHEHVGGYRSARQLSERLERASGAALRGSAGARLARQLHAYTAGTRTHMRREEDVFYAQAIDALERADWAELGGDAVPDDPMQDRSRLAQAYPRLAARLALPVREVSAARARAPGDTRWRVEVYVALRRGLERLVDTYGELLHDAADLAVMHASALRAVRSPLALARSARPVAASSCRFAVRCLTLPPRVVLQSARDLVALTRVAPTACGQRHKRSPG
jgi:hemerythrin-like domain-containing protein